MKKLKKSDIKLMWIVRKLNKGTNVRKLKAVNFENVKC
mgnify:CR=1 FL=1